jgi:sensor histidine kinase regulating citrate/malate metabolism
MSLFSRPVKRNISDLDTFIESMTIRKEQYAIKSSLYETLNAISKKNYITLHNDLPEVTR